MPLYEYQCQSCGLYIQQIKPISEFDSSCPCPCGKKAKIQVSLTGKPDFGFKPFSTDNITGTQTLIESRAQKRKLLKENNLCEV